MGSTFELAKVQFQPPSEVTINAGERENDSGEEDIDLSDVESAVTEEAFDPDREYIVDAIKWARYQDSYINDRNKRVNGKWMYAVLWKKYLKFPSEQEEPVGSFVHDEDSEGPDFIKEFWASFDMFNKQFEHLKVGKGRREPLAPPKHLRNKRYDTPDHQMKKWLAATKPRRQFSTFVKRRGFERQHPGAPIPKALSDYYVRKARMERKRAKNEEVDRAEAGNSTKHGSPTMEDLDILDSDQEDGPPAVKRVTNMLADQDDAPVRSGAEGDKGKKRKKRNTASPLPVVKAESLGTDRHIAKKVKKHEAPVASVSGPPESTSGPSTSRLSGIGKIKKRIVSPEAERSVHTATASLTEQNEPPPVAAAVVLQPRISPHPEPVATTLFGELEPGIFDVPDAPSAIPLTTAIDPPSDPSSPIIALPTPLFLSAPTDASSHAEAGLDDLFPPSPSHSGPPSPPPEPAPESPLSEVSASIDVSESPAVAIDAAPPAEAVPVVLPVTETSTQLQPAKSPVIPSEPVVDTAPSVDNPDAAARASEATPQPNKSSPSPPVNVQTTTAVAASQKGKYQQPKRIQVIDSVVEDSAAARIKQAQSYNPLGKIPLTGKPGVNAPKPIKPFMPPTGPSNPGRVQPSPHPAPPSQPRSWGLPVKPAVAPISSSTPGPARGPLPPQTSSFTLAGGQAIWKTGGPQTLDVPNSALSPNPSTSTVSPTISQGILPPPAPHPVRAIYNASADPRRRAPEPPRSEQGNLTPMSSISSTSQVYTPRSPQAPTHGASTGQSRTKAPEVLLDLEIKLPVRSDTNDPILGLRLLRGSKPMYGRNSVVMIDMLRSARRNPVNLEEMEMYNLGGQLRGGAEIVEWVKVAHTRPDDKEKRAEWLGMKARTKEDQCFVCYAEDKEARGITHHYAIVFAWADKVNLSHLDAGGWDKAAMEMVALLVALPLTGILPLLPNPVQSDLSQKIEYIKPDIGKGIARTPIDSYGFTEDFARTLTGRRTMVQGPSQPAGDKSEPTSALYTLYRAVVNGLITYNAIPVDSGTPEYLIIWNANFASRALVSSNVTPNLPRRTVIMTMGPALQLPPALWMLRRVWTTGGLVTFTPTFILRSPEKFAEIMRMIRCSDAWGAYILPAVVEWASLSWHEPARCPDPTKAFETLTKSLFLDHHLLQFSGSAATSGGGLAVTTCPPSPHLPTACAAWLEWRREVFSETDFQRLTTRCRGIRSDTFGKELERGDAKPLAMQELEQVDIEMGQMMDLAAMRARPHVVPYRRFILIGEMSLDKKMREKLGGAIECVQADDFAAIFSGAV